MFPPSSANRRTAFSCFHWIIAQLGFLLLLSRAGFAQELEPAPVAGQPLAANLDRVRQSLEFLGAPLPTDIVRRLATASDRRDAGELQAVIDPLVWFEVTVNPESKVKVRRGPGAARLQQAGYVAALVKIINQSAVTKELRVTSPQAGQVYAGMTPLSAVRLQREPLKEVREKNADAGRFLDLEMFNHPPMTPQLSGLLVEYTLALFYSRDAGALEATIGFEVGSGTQDLGYRGETAVLLDVRPAVPLKLSIRDSDDTPTTARLTFRDSAGHVFPPQAKRLAPDFYFQEQVYRRDGEVIWLPPGSLTVEFGRGPEYRTQRREILVPAAASIPRANEPVGELKLDLQRWVRPADFGFYSGDHHIHGAGCAHYTLPTEGVTPEDMFRQVEGEGLNVGCVLTWGPCYDFQRRYFSPGIALLSRPFSIMKYDLEVSGFGSESLGHVCLLNLRDQTFPGSDGTKQKGWPKWTTPVMRWAKAQGGYAGYAHSASGLEVHPQNAARRLMAEADADHDGWLTAAECPAVLLPGKFEVIDRDHDGAVIEAELVAAIDHAADELPNLAVPEMNGVGAMEVCVSTALGACDFISAMDTPRTAEWNMWYHLLSCGFPLKVSGETDFPCMSGDRVGQGRVYVWLGPVPRLDFSAWCDGLARGRSYVSDGFAHAFEFNVNDAAPGFGEVSLVQPGKVKVRAKVAFAPEQPKTTAHGGRTPPGGRRWLGDTVTMHGSPTRETDLDGNRRVEIVVNGAAVAHEDVPADGRVHELTFEVEITRSSWVALREFPQLHTNPVNVLVGGRSIRASRNSARWCLETIHQVWRQKEKAIPEPERREARAAFDEASAIYRRLATEADGP